MCRPAKLIQRGAHTYWHCPNCRRTMGEVTRESVVIKCGNRHLVILVQNDQIQKCPNCGVDSILEVSQVAA